MSEETPQNNQIPSQNEPEPTQPATAKTGQAPVSPTPSEKTTPADDALIQKNPAPTPAPIPTEETTPTDDALVQENPAPAPAPILTKDEPKQTAEENPAISETNNPVVEPTAINKDERPADKNISDIKTELKDTKEDIPSVQETKNTPLEEKIEPKQIITEIIPENLPTSQPINQQEIFKKILLENLAIANQKRKKQAKEKKNKILEYARVHNRIDSQTAKQLTGLSSERIRYYFNQLEKENKMIQIGRSGKKVFYIPKM